MDDAELSAEFGHCFRDIGRGADAVAHASNALNAAEGVSTRSDFFVTMVKADGLLIAGDVEHACAVATHALQLSLQVKSARCVEYLRAFRSRLSTHASTKHYRQFLEEATDHPLWSEAQNGRH